MQAVLAMAAVCFDERRIPVFAYLEISSMGSRRVVFVRLDLQCAVVFLPN